MSALDDRRAAAARNRARAAKREKRRVVGFFSVWALFALLWLAFWITVIFIALHFILKAW